MITEFLTAFIPIFAIVNPLGAVPRYVALTADQSHKERLNTARMATIIGCVLLVLFALSGEFVLRFYGITTDALQIAGGILLFMVGYEMVFKGTPRTKHFPEEIAETVEKNDVAIFPIAMPMMSGPGAITTVIILMSSAMGIISYASILGSIVLTYIIAYVLFIFAEKTHDLLGSTGTNVLTRVLGILVAAIAVEYVFTGIGNKIALLV